MQYVPAAFIHRRSGAELRQSLAEQGIAVAEVVLENRYKLVGPDLLALSPELAVVRHLRLQVVDGLGTTVGVVDLDGLILNEYLRGIGYVDLTADCQLLAVVHTGCPVIVPQRSRKELRIACAAEDVVGGRAGVKVHGQLLDQINGSEALDICQFGHGGVVVRLNSGLERVILLDHPLNFLLSREFRILRNDSLLGSAGNKPCCLGLITGSKLVLEQEVVLLHGRLIEGVGLIVYGDGGAIELIGFTGGIVAVLIGIDGTGLSGIGCLSLLQAIIIDALTGSENILVELIQRLRVGDQGVLAVLDLLGQNIRAEVFAVVEQVNQAGVRGIRHTDFIRDAVDGDVTHQGLVSVVSEQAVLLRSLAVLDQLSLVVQGDVVSGLAVQTHGSLKGGVTSCLELLQGCQGLAGFLIERVQQGAVLVIAEIVALGADGALISRDAFVVSGVVLVSGISGGQTGVQVDLRGHEQSGSSAASHDVEAAGMSGTGGVALEADVNGSLDTGGGEVQSVDLTLGNSGAVDGEGREVGVNLQLCPIGVSGQIEMIGSILDKVGSIDLDKVLGIAVALCVDPDTVTEVGRGAIRDLQHGG